MFPRKFLSVIVPVRFSDLRSDLIERIAFINSDSIIPNSVEFLVIDDGSAPDKSVLIKEKTEELGIKYLRIESSNFPFSVARARNFGAMHATSDYIMFLDVDLLAYDGFYRDVIGEIEVTGLKENVSDFLGIGVIYLTPAATKLYEQTPRLLRKQKFIHHLLENNSNYIQKFSTGTSVQVFNREYFLARGGNNEQFSGWGYEDIEFTCRLSLRSKKFQIPKLFLLDYKNCRDVVEYKGFKSLIRLHGDITFAKGIVLFHVPHTIDETSAYMQSRERNKKIFESSIKSYIDSKTEPEPLPDLSAGNTLIFTTTHPAIYNREVIPRWGNIFVEDESKFVDISIFAEYLKRHTIDRVVLQNPYSNAIRLAIYNYLRENKLDFIVVERGGLPNSMFFDAKGFHSDGDSYDVKHWDKELSEERRESIFKYIEKERNSDNFLEDQPEIIGKRALLRKLNINPGKKVLFVPLQTESDTVINYFCGNDVPTYQAFIDLVKELSNSLPDNWVMVIKQHPLVKIKPDIANAIGAHDYNIKDLIDAADIVLLINSGVGLLSMLWSKPVLYTGVPYYADSRINRKVRNLQEIVSYLINPFLVDNETIYRFLSYLLHDFYSFGDFKTKLVDWSENTMMTITTAIDFYRIPNLGKTKYVIDGRRINSKSILFDRYRFQLEYLKDVELKIQRPESKTYYEKINLMIKRYKKFKKDPYRYFNESRFFFLRPLKHLFR